MASHASDATVPQSPASASRPASNASRQNAQVPSSAISQHPVVLLGAFDRRGPYRWTHVRMMLSIFYQHQAGEGIEYELPDDITKFIDNPPTTLPINILHTDWDSDTKRRFFSYYAPLTNMTQAFMLGAAHDRKWHIWDAFTVMLQSDGSGTYRNSRWPSWKPGRPRTASQIIVPDDVVYQTIVAVFGQKAFINQPNVINPSHIPSDISTAGIRSECLNYVRSVAYDYVRNTLVKLVLKWEKEMKNVEKKGNTLLAELELRWHEIRMRREERHLDEEAWREWAAVESNTAKEKFKSLLSELQKTVQRHTKAATFAQPHRARTKWDQETAEAIYSLAGQFDRYLQLDARGNPAMIKALQQFRAEHSNGDDIQSEEVDGGNTATQPRTQDAPDLLTVAALKGTLDDPTDNGTYGLHYGPYLDAKHAGHLAGFDYRKWPRINANDLINGAADKQVPIRLRDHCCVGAVEVISRAFQTSGSTGSQGGRDPGGKFSYSGGCIIGDGTGLGKTAQAIQILGLVSHLATGLDLEDEDSQSNLDKYPAIMLSDRSTMLDELRQDAEKKIDPTETINRVLASAVAEGPSSFGHFGNTKQTLPQALPSIVVAPPSLIHHWKTEITRFASDSLMVIEVASPRTSVATLEPVFGLQKEWDEAKASGSDLNALANPSNQVILLSTHTLVGIWKTHKIKKQAKDVFALRYSVLIFDEVHLVKTKNSLQTATHQLSGRCSFTIGQTATPLVNSPLDIAYICNALNLRQAKNVANGDPEKAPSFFREAREAGCWQKKLDIAQTTEKMTAWYKQLPGGDQGRSAAYAADPLRPGDDLSALKQIAGVDFSLQPDYLEGVRKCLTVLGPYLMRRTKQALDRHGQRLVPLGALTEAIINVELRQDEIEDVHNYLDEMEENRLQQAHKVRSFHDRLGYYGPTYLPARAATIAPAFMAYRFDGLRGSANKISTKIAAVLDVISVHLATDARAKVPLAKQAKYVIHTDSKEILPALIYALELRSWSARIYDGSVSGAERRRIEAEVNSDEDHHATRLTARADGIEVPKTRILICTPVAGVGLNLFRTNVVLNLTFPWSHSAYEQRIGRHHRTPPSPDREVMPVTVYSILAINSVDLVMYTASLQKANLELVPYRRPNSVTDSFLLQPSDKPIKRRKRLSNTLPAHKRRGIPRMLSPVGTNFNLLVNYTQEAHIDRLGMVGTLEYVLKPKATFEVLCGMEAGGWDSDDDVEEPTYARGERLTSPRAVAVDEGRMKLSHAYGTEDKAAKKVTPGSEWLAARNAAIEDRSTVTSTLSKVVTEKTLRAAARMTYEEWLNRTQNRLADMKRAQDREHDLFDKDVWKELEKAGKDLGGDFGAKVKAFMGLEERRRVLVRQGKIGNRYFIPSNPEALKAFVVDALYQKAFGTDQDASDEVPLEQSLEAHATSRYVLDLTDQDDTRQGATEAGPSRTRLQLSPDPPASPQGPSAPPSTSTAKGKGKAPVRPLPSTSTASTSSAIHDRPASQQIGQVADEESEDEEDADVRDPLRELDESWWRPSTYDSLDDGDEVRGKRSEDEQATRVPAKRTAEGNPDRSQLARQLMPPPATPTPGPVTSDVQHVFGHRAVKRRKDLSRPIEYLVTTGPAHIVNAEWIHERRVDQAAVDQYIVAQHVNFWKELFVAPEAQRYWDYKSGEARSVRTRR